ncbi:ubiquitin-protein transferase [Aureococcus anophagefferens]|nr:ubiquitin-protein transferase [Aureococcus anophagefferens]
MEPPSCACACGSAGGAGSPPPDGSALEGAAILTTLGDACEAGPEPVPGSNPQHSTTAAAPPAEDAAPPVEDDDDLPDELFCPITYTMMRDPVRASDGHVYERLAITRWFAQRLTSPMTGAALADGALEPQDALRERIYDWAVARRGSPASRDYFSCAYCGDERCLDRDGCREAFERQVRTDAAYGAAARRRRWIEGNVLPGAERALRSGPAGAGALMLGAFAVGAVGAVLGGAASSLAEVATGGAEVAAGVADALSGAAAPAWDARRLLRRRSRRRRRRSRRRVRRRRPSPARRRRGPAAAAAAARGRRRGPRGAAAAPPLPTPAFSRRPRGDARASCSRGCIKIASGAVLVPVATVTVAAVFAVGAACGSVTLAAGIAKELVGGGVDAASMTYAAIGDAISSDVVELHVADDAARALPPPDAAA